MAGYGNGWTFLLFFWTVSACCSMEYVLVIHFTCAVYNNHINRSIVLVGKS